MSTASSIEPPPSLTPAQSTRQVAEARAALEAEILNIGSSLDHDLKTRAINLHSNNAALEKQQISLAEATKGLAKETDKLKKVADDAAKKLKEVGNVQNWAEVLERDFVVLEETLKMVERGSDGEDDELCEKCQGDLGLTEEDLVCWCRECDGLWHTVCVGLQRKPDGDWTCEQCQRQEAGQQDVHSSDGSYNSFRPAEGLVQGIQEERSAHDADVYTNGMDSPAKISEVSGEKENYSGSLFTHAGTGTESSSSHLSTSGTDQRCGSASWKD